LTLLSLITKELNWNFSTNFFTNFFTFFTFYHSYFACRCGSWSSLNSGQRRTLWKNVGEGSRSRGEREIHEVSVVWGGKKWRMKNSENSEIPIYVVCVKALRAL
jgi:hypothetical protein